MAMSSGLPAGISRSNQLFPAEKLVITGISFFSILIAIDHFIHGNREVFLVPLSLPVILLFLLLPRVRKQFQKKSNLAFVFSTLSLAGYAYLYKLAGALVTFLSVGWQDELLARLDRVVFRFSPNLAISYRSVWWTELMMFAYLAYLPLVVWLAFRLYRQKGQQELQKYAFALGLAYMTCFILFILVPAASPRFYFEGAGPTAGLFFRRLMNLVERSAQYRGGSFPSAHCAAGTVMLYFALRAGKKVSLVVILLIILFFISTVYGQYHYGVDVLAGMIIGLLAILANRIITGRWTELPETPD